MDDIEEELISLAILLAGILVYNGQRNRHRLTRSALLPPRQAPWMQLLNFGDQSSFLDLTGFTRPAFMELEAVLFGDSALGKRGRPSLLDDRGQLGLYLFFLGSRMQYKHLCLIFGITPTSACDYINRLMVLVCEKLKRHPLARIQLPDRDTMQEYAHIVHLREPRVMNCIGFVDGVAIPVQCGSSPEEQGTNYNGYHHDTNVNNVFAFAPTGKIIWAAINAPGSWHDSTVCSQLIAWAITHLEEYCMCVSTQWTIV